MRNFEMPKLALSMFDTENVITDSAPVGPTAVEQARTAAGALADNGRIEGYISVDISFK